MPTAKKEKHVFWFDDGRRPNAADALEAKYKDITVHRLAFDGPQADNWGAMSISQAYCITSARHEVPDEYKAHAALIERCPDLLAVSTTGAGYDTVDVPACTAAGVLVVNQTGSNADAVSEHAVAMMLSLTKKIPQTDRSLRTERGVSRETFKGWNANGRTLGIIGFGNVGTRVARICGLGLQMRVLAYDPYVSKEKIEAGGATKVDLATLLKEARFISVHCPLTDETGDMIAGPQLAAMPAGGYVITTARGGIVSEGALEAALKSGPVHIKRIAAVGILGDPVQRGFFAVSRRRKMTVGKQAALLRQCNEFRSDAFERFAIGARFADYLAHSRQRRTHRCRSLHRNRIHHLS